MVRAAGQAAEPGCLSADLKRLRGLQREMLRSAGKKRENLQTDFAALLAASQAAVAARRAVLRLAHEMAKMSQAKDESAMRDAS